MIALEREDKASGPVVQGFAGQAFRVDNRLFNSGIWLTPEWVRAWIAPAFDGLTGEELGPLLRFAPRPEFLLLGTGSDLRRPSPQFVSAVETCDIGVEAMASRAAARSWGMLRSEGRWCIAALMPLDQS